MQVKPLSKVVSQLDISPIRQFEAMARVVGGIISLAQGIPSFETPTHIKQAAKDAIDQGLSDKYTTGWGIEALRVAIAEKVKNKNGIHIANSQTIVTHGAIEATIAIFLALLDDNDEVIILTPAYASHFNQILLAARGVRPVEVPQVAKNGSWQLDSELLEKSVNNKTKAIVFSNPTNPTGKAFTRDELKEIARIAVKHNLYVVTEEMYEYFTFDGKEHISIGSFPEVADRTLSIFGFSKTYAMTGWRIGYVVAEKNLVEQIYKVHDALVLCPTAISQYAALAALKGPQDCIEKHREGFLTRRDITLEMLSQTNKVDVVTPEGTYYAFPKIQTDLDDVTLAEKLIKEAKVALVAGSGFGKAGRGHLRISFGCGEEILRAGLERLVTYLNEEL